MCDSVKNYRDALEKAGIKTVFYESPGTAHEWQTWRRSLRDGVYMRAFGIYGYSVFQRK